MEILTDENGLGRQRPWRVHKMANEYLAMAYDDVNPAKAERMRECANVLSFTVTPAGKKKLVAAKFCRVRLCPVCTWRRSLKVAGQMRDIMANIAESDEPLRYLFMTLTVRNCSADELNGSISHLLESFKRLGKQLAFKRVVVGWYRGLEVTHNVNPESESFDTFHPHLHTVIAVKETFFSGRNYITQETWTEMWQQALRVDYTPVVNVKAIKGDTAKAVAEAAKYSVKVSDILVPDDWEMTVNTLRVLDLALHQRRLVAYGGRFKDVHKLLRLDDAEDGDLVHTTQETAPEGGQAVYHYAWYSGYRQYGKVGM